MDAAALIGQIYAARESWCELQPGVRVRLRRPAEAEMPQFYRGVGLEAVKGYTVGWEGMTAALLFGASVGSDDAVKFDAALWGVIVADNSAWLGKCAQHLAKAIETHLEATQAAAGNSAPSSTPAQA